MQTSLLTLGRVLLASLFVISGIRKIMGWAGTLGYMQSKGLPATEILLVATIALELIGGLMVAFNMFAMPAAVLLAGFCLVSGVIFHNFWAIGDAAQYSNQMIHFMKNVALAGGLLITAAASQNDSTRSG
jgi:putative oxidoreductase